MNIYEKIQKIKEKILTSNLKKSGNNKFANFKYYELQDFVPYVIKFCGELKLLTIFRFNNQEGILRIVNAEKPEETLEYDVPMRKVDLKGCNEVQALGGSLTYLKRYLFMNAFDITENDQFDCRPLNDYACDECGAKFSDIIHSDKLITAKVQYDQTKKKYGQALCQKCREELK